MKSLIEKIKEYSGYINGRILPYITTGAVLLGSCLTPVATAHAAQAKLKETAPKHAGKIKDKPGYRAGQKAIADIEPGYEFEILDGVKPVEKDGYVYRNVELHDGTKGWLSTRNARLPKVMSYVEPCTELEILVPELKWSDRAIISGFKGVDDKNIKAIQKRLEEAAILRLEEKGYKIEDSKKLAEYVKKGIASFNEQYAKSDPETPNYKCSTDDISFIAGQKGDQKALRLRIRRPKIGAADEVYDIATIDPYLLPTAAALAKAPEKEEGVEKTQLQIIQEGYLGAIEKIRDAVSAKDYRKADKISERWQKKLAKYPELKTSLDILAGYDNKAIDPEVAKLPPEEKPRFSVGLGASHSDEIWSPEVSAGIRVSDNCSLLFSHYSGAKEKKLPDEQDIKTGTIFTSIGIKKQNVETEHQGYRLGVVMDLSDYIAAIVGLENNYITKNTTTEKLEQIIIRKTGKVGAQNRDTYFNSDKSHDSKIYFGLLAGSEDLKVGIGVALGENPTYNSNVNYNFNTRKRQR